jgi:hypothetical protein
MSGKSPLVVWTDKAEKHGCALKDLSGVDDVWELLDGLPRAERFPDDASYSMHPDFPDDTLLTDSLINSDMLIVASPKLKAFVEARKLKKVEYLPLRIIDHKGKVASKDYFIIHPIEPVDCLDLEASGAIRSTIDTETIRKVKRLVLDESKLDPDRELFRPKGFYRATLVRRALAQAIDAAGFTGVRWTELDKYRG